MELIIKDMQLPEAIEFNFEELKQELAEKVSFYEGLVYTEAQLKEAKSDRAKLNKFKKLLNDERIRREREYMMPFLEFKAKVNELIGIIDTPVAMIDEQIKAYEQMQKEEKRNAIKQWWDAMAVKDGDPAGFVTLEQIWNEKWLNSSVSMQTILEEITATLQRIRIDLQTLSSLPEFGFEAVQVYKQTLDISKAVSEGKRLAEMQKEREGFEPSKAIPTAPAGEVEDGFLPSFDGTEAVWRTYRISLTADQKKVLEQFLIASGIVYQEA